MRDLYLGDTDEKGVCTASFSVPASAEGAALLLDLTHERGSQQFKLHLGKKS
jgi:hypothetical protein